MNRPPAGSGSNRASRWFATAVLAGGLMLTVPELAGAQTSTTSGATTSTGPPTTTTTTTPPSTTTTTAGGGVLPGGVPPVDRRPPTVRTPAPPVTRGQPARRVADTGASTDRELTGAALLVCVGSALLVAGHVQRRRHRRIP